MSLLFASNGKIRADSMPAFLLNHGGYTVPFVLKRVCPYATAREAHGSRTARRFNPVAGGTPGKAHSFAHPGDIIPFVKGKPSCFPFFFKYGIFAESGQFLFFIFSFTPVGISVPFILPSFTCTVATLRCYIFFCLIFKKKTKNGKRRAENVGGNEKKKTEVQ